MTHPVRDVSDRPRPKQTGPKTPVGKARAKMNAARHGLRAAATVLPGEDPAEYEQFLSEVIDSLTPVGTLEEELARRAAAELWRLRRTEYWEAARARLNSHVDPDKVNARLAQVDKEVADLRAELAAQQRDPAADPPLASRLGGLPDPARIDLFELDDLYDAWADRLPDPEAAPGLGAVCERVGLPEEAGSEPYAWDGWTAANARLLIGEFAKTLGTTAEEFLGAVEAEWKAGLNDERARRRRRRVSCGGRSRSWRSGRPTWWPTGRPRTALRLDLLARYQAAAQRGFDRALKALLAAQEARPDGRSS